ncbi:SpoIIIAC/SpoIIIAD family protein [[Clostridium] fimetarium]|uniref:Stage III sporulation protein AD n=1 Tax=[Clostridium] fimetarium TaxID=99656 RepID=A0A1I0RV18_9FIRM|nr:SpoIIIAC/SpoIIIAD family protein [[Clostridium] fimetarium]SEW45296.1 stage III sporulation protein AD [[Clostridium] fimetarium]
MEIIKLSILAITGVLLAIMLKNGKNEYSTYIALGTSVILFFYVVGKVGVIVETINKVQSYISISETYIEALIKMVGITYISELTSSICKDAGYNSVSGQIEIFGKISILAVSMPIVLSLMETIDKFIG